jgi:deoxyribodipyrimidine photo-lyase
VGARITRNPHGIYPSAMEQQLCDFTTGIDYPTPIVDLEETQCFASEKMWGSRKDDEVKKDALRLLK